MRYWNLKFEYNKASVKSTTLQNCAGKKKHTLANKTTVYHITSGPKKQAFLGPITKVVAKLVARHKTSRIQGI